jgi:hypothetical protein
LEKEIKGRETVGKGEERRGEKMHTNGWEDILEEEKHVRLSGPKDK